MIDCSKDLERKRESPIIKLRRGYKGQQKETTCMDFLLAPIRRREGHSY
jgi:hypothetical protein